MIRTEWTFWSLFFILVLNCGCGSPLVISRSGRQSILDDIWDADDSGEVVKMTVKRTISVDIDPITAGNENIDDSYDISYRAFNKDVNIRVRRSTDANKDKEGWSHDASVFSKDFKMMTMDTTPSGEPVMTTTTPSKRELFLSESEIYSDVQSQTTVRIRETEKGTEIQGIVDGASIQRLRRKGKEDDDDGKSDDREEVVKAKEKRKAVVKEKEDEGKSKKEKDSKKPKTKGKSKDNADDDKNVKKKNEEKALAKTKPKGRSMKPSTVTTPVKPKGRSMGGESTNTTTASPTMEDKSTPIAGRSMKKHITTIEVIPPEGQVRFFKVGRKPTTPTTESPSVTTEGPVKPKGRTMGGGKMGKTTTTESPPASTKKSVIVKPKGRTMGGGGKTTTTGSPPVKPKGRTMGGGKMGKTTTTESPPASTKKSVIVKPKGRTMGGGKGKTTTTESPPDDLSEEVGTRVVLRKMDRPHVEVVHEDRPLKKMRGRGLSGGIQSIEPEVLVILDYANTKEHKGDKRAILDYLSILFKNINNRYVTLKDIMKINFKISGVVNIRSRAAQPFLEENIVPDKHGYDIVKALDSFSKWMYKKIKAEPDLPKHDMAAVITGQEMVTLDNATGKYEDGVTGFAYVKGACWTHEEAQKFMGTSVTEDIGGYWFGVFSIAHEFAHNLGAPHDGKPEDKTEQCPAKDGFLMSYDGWGEASKFHFSNCSAQHMKEFIESSGAACMKFQNSKYPWLPSTKDIGDELSMKALCIKYTKSPKAYVDPTHTPSEHCRNLFCRIPGDAPGKFSWTDLKHGAGENAPCAKGKRCKAGDCVDYVSPFKS